MNNGRDDLTSTVRLGDDCGDGLLTDCVDLYDPNELSCCDC